MSRQTPETRERCIRSCNSGDHRAIHICQNVSSPEENIHLGAFGERHIWRDCVTSWKRVGTEWFGSPRWTADKHCDATNNTTKSRKKPIQLATTAKNQAAIETSAVNSKDKNTDSITTRIMPAVLTTTLLVVRQHLTPTKTFPTIPTQTRQKIKKTENLDLSIHPVRPMVKVTTPRRNVTLEQMQRTDRLPERMTGRTKSSPTEKCPKQLRWECSSCSPNFNPKTPRLHSGVACDRPETNKTAKLPPVSEVVCQQPPKTFTDQCNLNNTTNDSTVQYTQELSKATEGSQTSPSKE